MKFRLQLSCLLILTIVQCLYSLEGATAKQASESNSPQPSDKHAAAESAPSGAEKQSDKSNEAKGTESKNDADKDWEEYLEASRKSYSEGKMKDAANELDLALAAAEHLKVGITKANVFLQLGEQYLNLKQYERAKVLMEEGLSVKRKVPGFKSVASANAMDNLAQAYSRTGNLDGASKIELDALSTYESLHKTETHDYAIALSNHANTLRQLKQNKDAEQFFAKAVATQQRIDKSDSVELAKILLNAGGLYCDMNRLSSAKRLLDRAAKIINSKLPPEHPLYKLSIKSQRVYHKKFVDELLKKDPNPIRPEVAQAVAQLAALYNEEGDVSQAAAAYKQAVSIQEKLLPADSPELKKTKDEYASCLKKVAN